MPGRGRGHGAGRVRGKAARGRLGLHRRRREPGADAAPSGFPSSHHALEVLGAEEAEVLGAHELRILVHVDILRVQALALALRLALLLGSLARGGGFLASLGLLGPLLRCAVVVVGELDNLPGSVGDVDLELIPIAVAVLLLPHASLPVVGPVVELPVFVGSAEAVLERLVHLLELLIVPLLLEPGVCGRALGGASLVVVLGLVEVDVIHHLLELLAVQEAVAPLGADPADDAVLALANLNLDLLLIVGVSAIVRQFGLVLEDLAAGCAIGSLGVSLEERLGRLELAEALLAGHLHRLLLAKIVLGVSLLLLLLLFLLLGTDSLLGSLALVAKVLRSLLAEDGFLVVEVNNWGGLVLWLFPSLGGGWRVGGVALPLPVADVYRVRRLALHLFDDLSLGFGSRIRLARRRPGLHLRQHLVQRILIVPEVVVVVIVDHVELHHHLLLFGLLLLLLGGAVLIVARLRVELSLLVVVEEVAVLVILLAVKIAGVLVVRHRGGGRGRREIERILDPVKLREDLAVGEGIAVGNLVVTGKVRALGSLAHDLALRLSRLGLLARHALLLGLILGGRLGGFGGGHALGSLGFEPLHLVLQLALILGILQIRLVGLLLFAGAVGGVFFEPEAVEGTLLLQHDFHLALLVVGAVHDILLLVLDVVLFAVGIVELEAVVVEIGHPRRFVRLLLLLLLNRALAPQLELLLAR